MANLAELKGGKRLRIAIDTREQQPWTFDGLSVDVVHRTMRTGDYAAADHDGFVIERKSAPDLLACLGCDRDRFIAELARLEGSFTTSAVVVECQLSVLIDGSHRSKIHPSAVIGTLSAWSQRMPTVHWWFCPSRRWAEKLTYRLLLRWSIDAVEGKSGGAYGRPVEASA